MTGQDRRLVVIWEAETTNVHMAARNFDSGNYAVNQIDNGMLNGQWKPQRSGIIFDRSGKCYWAQIEDTSNDLEIWANNAAGWQIDGTWTENAENTSQDWEALDVEARQSHAWGGVYETSTPNAIHGFTKDLKAGAPAITLGGSVPSENDEFSLALDSKLYGITNLFHRSTTDKYSAFIMPSLAAEIADTLAATFNSPQLLTDGHNILWAFSTLANDLQVATYGWPYGTIAFFDHDNPVYTGTNLTDAYMASWRPEDDTIHIVLVDWDFDGENVDFDLKYLRRAANGWIAPITVDSWTIPIGDMEAQLLRLTPQITNQPNGIVINNVEYVPGAAEGQLNAFFLPNSLYHDPTAGNWVKTGDIAVGIDCRGCNAPEYWPAK